MAWDDVGGWLKDNAGTGAALIGSLLTGNIPGAIASGVSLVSSATGTDDPVKALGVLQASPDAMIRLKELAVEEEQSIRAHIQAITRLKLEDKQAAHHETQETIRAGDKAEDRVVRYTRPGQSWISLAMAGAYVFTADNVDIYVLGALLALPFSYAGLRQIGKGVDALAAVKGAVMGGVQKVTG